MAGIYIHIPFCRSLCNYCDFYRVTNSIKKNDLLKCMLKEIDMKNEFFGHESVETIYFGGGTPSILSDDNINLLIDKIYSSFDVSENTEISLEVNPDDLSSGYLKSLKNNTLINRLSIGIQSFIDRDLLLMNRRHNAEKAVNSIKQSLDAGFLNLSIDLIYGLPGMSQNDWEYNLNMAFSMEIKHLSAYHLTIEEGTVFAGYIKAGKFSEVNEEESINQFSSLVDIAGKNGFVQYEISNLAKESYFSKHNSNYWKQKKYLGIGPSAHSYNLQSRHWNIANNDEYIKRINQNRSFYQSEQLDNVTKYNEFVMTGLRTMWGINPDEITIKFGDLLFEYFNRNSEKFIKNSELQKDGQSIKLTDKGKFVSDYIISELMFVE